MTKFKEQPKLKLFFYFLTLTVLILGLSISFQSLLAAWTAPTSAPPGDNVPAPLNQGNNWQTKDGGLWLVGNTTVAGASFIIEKGNVLIGTTSGDYKLTVAGSGPGFPAGEPEIAIYGASENPQYNPGIVTMRARGTLSARGIVQEDDQLFAIHAYGYDGAPGNAEAAEISVEVDGAVSGGNVPGRLEFRTTSVGGGDNAETRMVIKANGNVGIGTTSPREQFQVFSKNYQLMGYESMGGPYAPICGCDGGDNINKNCEFRFSAGNDDIGTVCYDNYSWNKSVRYEVIDTSFSVSETGGVGIGTSSAPQSGLYVLGDKIKIVDTSPEIIFSDYTGTIPPTDFAMHQADNTFRISADIGQDGSWDDIMTFLNNGNVGIGTDNPGTILTIVGGEEDVDHYNYTDDAGSSGAEYQVYRAHGTEATPLDVAANDVIGGMTFKGYVEAGSDFTSGAKIRARNGGSWGDCYNDAPMQLEFLTKPDVAAGGCTGNYIRTRMVIKANGNVGINTTDPTHKLEVVATNNEDAGFYIFSNVPDEDFDLKLYRSRGTPTAKASVVNGDSIGGLVYGAYDGDEFHRLTYIESVMDGGVGNNDMPTKLNFYTTPDGTVAPEIRLVIKNNGNVGIGLTSPENKLHIRGAEDIGIDWGSDDGMGDVMGKGQLIIEDKDAGISLIAKTDTTDSSRLLMSEVDVAGNYIDTWGIFRRGNASDNALRFGYGKVGSGAFNWDTNAKLTILPSGNVGIGTVNPTEKLYVSGSTWSTTGWSSSDERWKKNIVPLENSLKKVNELQGVNYEWKIEEYPENGFEVGEQIGLIAQEMEKVIPELVRTGDDGYKAIAYDRLTVVLLEAIKELKIEKDAEIKELQEQINTLTDIICELKLEVTICD